MLASCPRRLRTPIDVFEYRMEVENRNPDQVVADWIQQYGVGKSIAKSKQKGGWEGWAQAELETVLRDNLPCVVAQREVTDVFQNNANASVDFVCPSVSNTQPPFFLIELKCQSTFQDSVSLNHFAQRLQADVTKIQPAVKESFAGAEKWVIGICCNPTIAQATENFVFNPPGTMRVRPVQDGDQVAKIFYATY